MCAQHVSCLHLPNSHSNTILSRGLTPHPMPMPPPLRFVHRVISRTADSLWPCPICAGSSKHILLFAETTTPICCVAAMAQHCCWQGGHADAQHEPDPNPDPPSVAQRQSGHTHYLELMRERCERSGVLVERLKTPKPRMPMVKQPDHTPMRH